MNSEKEIKNLICKTIAEATGTPNDFQEGHCANTACDSCIFDTLSKEIYKLYYNSIKEFAEELYTNAIYTYDDLNKERLFVIEVQDIQLILKEFLNNE